jgi:hypothetical protein
MHSLGYLLLALSALTAVSNFFISFIRPLYYNLRKEKYKFVSIIPLIGNILLVPAAFLLPTEIFLRYVALAIVLIDTGGLPWIFLMLLGNLIVGWKRKAS